MREIKKVTETLCRVFGKIKTPMTPEEIEKYKNCPVHRCVYKLSDLEITECHEADIEGNE